MIIPTIKLMKGDQVAIVNESDKAEWLANGWAVPEAKQDPEKAPPRSKKSE